MTDPDLTFIETQLPVSKLSKESYVERKSHLSQTLTSLGKWWGRKPLILVRAAVLGLLLPASDDPRADREVFLKLLTMNDAGLWRRKSKPIALKDVYGLLTPAERRDWFRADADPARPKLRAGLEPADRERLQRLAFERLSYDDKLGYCDRPEQVPGPDADAWAAINAHLDTHADSLPALVKVLGERRFGHVPTVGDAFCGGGSVPFEAARIGCNAVGSDLNPVAALLTWAALHIVGGGPAVAARVREAQQRVFAAVDRQITDWRIEHNAAGWRADAYLYCAEARCPDCGWRVPLAPSWVVGVGSMTRARLVADAAGQRFDIAIDQGVTRAELDAAKAAGTVRDSRLHCPQCHESNAIATIRGNRGLGLRLWENADVVPRPDDVFQERLYCVRWRLPGLADLLWAEQHQRHGGGAEHPRPVPDWVPLDGAIAALADWLDAAGRDTLALLRERDWPAEDQDLADAEAAWRQAVVTRRPQAEMQPLRSRFVQLRDAQRERVGQVAALAAQVPSVRYAEADVDDLAREARVLALLRERFDDWQRQGFVPSRNIEFGEETTRLRRERGWTHWHQLFTARQLLLHAIIGQFSEQLSSSEEEKVDLLLSLGRSANWDSRLCQWGTGAARESIAQTFYNQAFNTLLNYPSKSLRLLFNNFGIEHETVANLAQEEKAGHAALWPSYAAGAASGVLGDRAEVRATDARGDVGHADLWITDPPYADAIVYHELSEFFLAWYEKHLPKLFPDWSTDSRRALAIQGSGKGFREAMVATYRNLAARMPGNGLQIVMFTHQDAGVWADLALILWAAGLRVTAAWTIATETESALKAGNYVQGTVLMVLRKRVGEETAFLDELVPQVETEVQEQLRAMLALDDKEDPNFTDADYQLAAYAAALRVLTRYANIEDLDIAYELGRERGARDKSPIEAIIEDAVRTASNYLVPVGLDAQLWRRLTPEERLYVKCLEVESHGEYRSGVFMEFARGLGVRDYRYMLHSGRANQTRLSTASEFQRREWGGEGFGASLLRHCLYAVYQTAADDDPARGRTYLKTELGGDYWPQRQNLIALAEYLSRLPMAHWRGDAEAARVLAGLLRQDSV
jgi:adenine-specific DNA methylase